MKNGYFRLVNTQKGYGVQLVKAREGGTEINGMDLTAYLDREGLSYEMSALKAALNSDEDTVLELGAGPCPVVNESYTMTIDKEGMQAQVVFRAPSDTGKRVELTEVLKELRLKNILYGIQMGNLSQHFQSEGCYDNPVTVAQGKLPIQGKDAWIEYFFNTDPHIQPTMREDGSVDYFQLNVINHCRAGEELARIHPAVPGEPGMNIYGKRVPARDVKPKVLKFGNNIQLSEDELSITSLVDGHVTLVDDKVFVSNVYEVEDVDFSTGNIEFTGSVQVNGNVKENMCVTAGGNVVVRGTVEGARIEAGGNIIIAGGMNGMTKGVLKAGGDVLCRFLENTSVSAGGYVNTEAILHSQVSAKMDITVSGRKGFIIGGQVRAGRQISVKNLGANMGNATVVEVGSDPEVKNRLMVLQKEVTELAKDVKNAQPTLVSFAEKKAKGYKFTSDQLKLVVETDKMLREKTAELRQKNEELKILQERFESQKGARVMVSGTAYTGTTIIIEDLSLTLKSEYSYCRFEKKDGEVKSLPL